MLKRFIINTFTLKKKLLFSLNFIKLINLNKIKI